MQIIIKNTSSIAIYEQIEEQIKIAILNEELKEGDVLPSLRKLASDLRISILTVQKAYLELENDGYLISIHGKGYYISAKGKELIKMHLLNTAEENFRLAVKNACEVGYEIKELHELLDQVWTRMNKK